MKKILICMSLVLLHGCALKPYIPPVDGESVATLLIPAEKKSYKIFGGFSQSKIDLAVSGANDCGTFSAIPKPKSEGEKFVEVLIPAHKTTFLRSTFVAGNATCSPAVSFIPKESGRYMALPQIGFKSCAVQVIETSNEEKGELVEVKRVYVDTWVGRKVCSQKKDL